MVKITDEHTWERLLKVKKKIKKTNEELYNQRNVLMKKKKRLEKEKKILEINKNAKIIDKDATFKFCKHNYAYYRTKIYNHELSVNESKFDPKKYSKEQIMHLLTVEYLRSKGKNLNFEIDDYTFEKSMTYWQQNYTQR